LEQTTVKLGILRYSGIWNIDSLVEDVASAAAAGFSSYWIPNLGVAVDNLMALAIAGREVPEIELGAGVVPTWTRHPLVMGQSALTASSVIGDRLSLGLGLVHKTSVAHNWGYSFDRPITHIREYLEILRPVLANEPVEYVGQTLTARSGPILPGAPQPGLYLAALGTQMLKVAGRHADGSILWMTGPNTLRQHTLPTISAAAQEVGRPQPRILAGTPVLVTDHEQAGRALAAQAFSRYATLPTYLTMMAHEGVSGPEGMAVVGEEKAVRDRFAEFFAAGTDDVLCAEFADNDEERDRTRACLIDLLKVPAS
jgi:5,10-methylenetetrahydromethanopterin reductase